MENPEKYISIEYDKWLNYYKPLEENYKGLQKQYEDLLNQSYVEAKEKIYNEYVGTDNLLAFKSVIDVGVFSTIKKKYLFEIVLNDAAKILANQLLDKRLNSIPKFIRRIFKIKTNE